MTLTIDLPDDLEAALQAHAHAEGISTVSYARKVLQQVLTQQNQPVQPIKSAYGLLSQYDPASSEEEMDEDRREMFQNFIL